MKKALVLALFLIVIGSGSFAAENAAGGGVMVYDFDFKNIGIFGFYDIGRYATLNFGIYNLFNNNIQSMIEFGAYFKYPFYLSQTFLVYPAGGVDANVFESLWTIWIRAGLGLDIFFSERLFVRGKVMFGYFFDFKGNSGFKAEPIIKLALGWKL